MPTNRPFYPRLEVKNVGDVRVSLRVENLLDPRRGLDCNALVDTGSVSLVLPAAWRDRFGTLPEVELVDVELADQRVVTAEVRGPVRIRVDRFRRIVGEVMFTEMTPRPDGSYEPLVGYMILEACNVVVDPVARRLVARKAYPMKRLAAA